MRTILINWENIHIHHKHWVAHHRLRRKIFIERLGWDLPCKDGLEFDEFDTPAAQYVLVVDDNDKVRGVSRLNTTVNSYMIEKNWSDWLDIVPPRSDRVWEATRFGVDEQLDAKSRAEVIRLITSRIYRFAQENEIHEVLLTMPVFIYSRILIPLGYDLTYLSNVRPMEGVKTAIASVRIHAFPQARTLGIRPIKPDKTQTDIGLRS